MQTQALPGFRDFYPPDLALRTHIFDTWRAVAARYGFEEYDGPPLEPLELYTAKSGDEIVGQLYSFEDKGDRAVSLRPEMTPTLARMVAARANGLKKPIRWFAIPQLFRYERQQRGRLREHFQLNCDLIGEVGPQADAEIIALAIDVMRAFGLTARDVQVRLSDRRVLNAILVAVGVRPEQFAAAYAVIDKLERSSAAESRARLEAAGIPTAATDRLLAALASTDIEDVAAMVCAGGDDPNGLHELGLAAVGNFTTTVEALAAMGLRDFVKLDLRIVRGLAYYTGTVFEVFDAGRTLRAICGGGRYDNLLQAVGGVDLPALGFGMGDVVLGELLRDRDLLPSPGASIDVFVAGIGDDDLPHVLALAHELRDAGVRTEYALAAQAVGKQLKLADARGARFAVVIGPDDRARGEVIVKALGAKTQQATARDAAVAAVVRLVGDHGGTAGGEPRPRR